MSWEYSIIKHIKNKKVLSLMSSLLQVPYRTLFKLLPSQKEKRNKKYFFSVCGIFKDEAAYLKEWIDYYKVIGTSHIYLYNNNSTDNFMDVLDPYINEGFVTLVNWEKNYAQIESYEDCYNRFAGETKWLAFFDIDEFLCPKIDKNIESFLSRYKKYPGILIYWKMFGTNGQLDPQKDKLVTEQYTSSWKNLDKTGKVIISTSSKFSPRRIYHHHMWFTYRLFNIIKIKIPVITEHQRFVFFPSINQTQKHNTIQLNHYFSKSFSEYIAKINKTDAANPGHDAIRRKFDFFLNHELNNISIDKSIFRFMILLKKKYYNLEGIKG